MSNIKKILQPDRLRYEHKRTFITFNKAAEEGKHIKDPKKLFGNYILENDLVLFPSPQGTGKSWLVMQLCIAIAAGWEYFLGECIELNGNTLFTNYELGSKKLKKRIERLRSNLPFPDCKRYHAFMLDLRKPLKESLADIIEYVIKYKIILVVIDNLRTATLGVDFNNGTEMAILMNQLVEIKNCLNITIVIVDHFRKHTSSKLTESDLQSGSGVKSIVCDSDMFLRKSCQSPNYRILKRCKSRNAEESTSTKLVLLNPDTMWFELVEEDVNEAEHIGVSSISDKEEKKDMATTLRKQGKSYEEIAQILGVGKTTVHRWLKDFKEE
jgi:hypothetical protein